MNTVEESAIAHKNEHKPGTDDLAVERGRRNELDHEATGTSPDGGSVNV